MPGALFEILDHKSASGKERMGEIGEGGGGLERIENVGPLVVGNYRDRERG